MITLLKTQIEFTDFISNNDAVLVYYSHNECNVCKVLKPKLEKFLDEDFSRIKMAYVNIKETPEVSAQNSIFTVPTLIIYFEAKEYIRRSRNVSISELGEALTTPYKLLFAD